MRRYSFFAAALIWLIACVPAESRIYLDVYGQTYKKVTIGAPVFRGGDGKAATEMTEVLHKDLDFSGFFIPAPLSLMDRELTDEGVTRQEINFGNWRSIGVDLVAKGRLEATAVEISLEAYLYETSDGSLLLAKRYRGKREDLRRIVHRLADDIVQAVTGEKGIMDTRVVFIGGSGTKKDIYMADLDGANVKRLTNHRAMVVSPSVSPDGKYLAYTSYREGRANLYVVDLETNREVFADREEGLKLGTGWLNKGALGYAHTSGRYSSLITVDVATKAKQTILRQEGITASPSFAPDGRRMVFVSDMYGNPQLFLRDLVSGETKRLTYQGTYNTSPAFSPKGDLIAYVASVGGSFEICIMNADGSNQRILTSGGFNDSPQFSPCGRYIIYYARDGQKESIHLMLHNGDNRRALKYIDSSESQPRFTP
jgi:TolB protein